PVSQGMMPAADALKKPALPELPRDTTNVDPTLRRRLVPTVIFWLPLPFCVTCEDPAFIASVPGVIIGELPAPCTPLLIRTSPPPVVRVVPFLFINCVVTPPTPEFSPNINTPLFAAMLVLLGTTLVVLRLLPKL